MHFFKNKKACSCVFFLYFKFNFFLSFCSPLVGFGRIEMRETITFYRPLTHIICSSPSILRLSSILSYGTVLRKESLVLCLVILLFSSHLLSLFQMLIEMLENPSILISTFTGWKACCGMGLNRSHASCIIYGVTRGNCLSHFCLVLYPF